MSSTNVLDKKEKLHQRCLIGLFYFLPSLKDCVASNGYFTRCTRIGHVRAIKLYNLLNEILTFYLVSKSTTALKVSTLIMSYITVHLQV